MMDFFSSLLSYIEIAWEFFLNFINSMATLAAALSGAVRVPVIAATSMWAPIAASVTAVAGFAVVKLLLGRSSV